MLEAGFKKWLASTDTVILVCWDLGHIWDADIYDTIDRVHGAYVMTGSCQRRCGVVRTRYLASDFSPDSNKNSYRYPHGYSPKGFITHPKGQEYHPFFMSWEHRAAIRRELAGRAQEHGGVRQRSSDDAEVISHPRFSG